MILGNKAKILIQPSLHLNRISADLKLIKDQLVTVTTKTDTDIPSTLNFSSVVFE